MEKDLSNYGEQEYIASPSLGHGRSYVDPKSLYGVFNSAGYFNQMSHRMFESFNKNVHNQNHQLEQHPDNSHHELASVSSSKTSSSSSTCSNSNSPTSDLSTSSASASSPSRSLSQSSPSSSYVSMYNKPMMANPANFSGTAVYENYFTQTLGRFNDSHSSYSHMPSAHMTPLPHADWQASTPTKSHTLSQSSHVRTNSSSSEKASTSVTPNKRPKSTFPFGKCKVCSDKATGVHYGISTCEGCKGFFKRSTLRKEKYRCFFGNNCPLTPDNRNRCKACRFKKCLDVGMSIQGVKMGRIPKAEKERALMNLSYSTSAEKEDDQQLDEENTDLDSNGEEIEDEENKQEDNSSETLGRMGDNQRSEAEFTSKMSKTISQREESIRDDNSSDEYAGTDLDPADDDASERPPPERPIATDVLPNSSKINQHQQRPHHYYQNANSAELSNIQFGSLSISNHQQNDDLDGQSFGKNKRKLSDKQLSSCELDSRSPSPIESSSKCLVTVQSNITSRVASLAAMFTRSSPLNDRKFSFMSDLLNIHKTFKSPNSLLPRTRLSTGVDDTSGDSYRLDESIQIIMSLLTNRVYQIYIEHTRDVREMCSDVKRLMAASGSRRPSPLIGRDQVTLADVWDGLLEGIPKCVKGLISIARELPGINELDTKDFTTIINNHLFNYYLLRFSPLYIDGENYSLLSNNIQYTRHWMLKVIGEDMVEALFAWTEKFNELELTSREIALLFPYLLTKSEGKFEDPQIINNLNEYYYRAILYEFDLNHRSTFFMSRWKEVIDDLPKLNEMQAKSIGKLTPATSS